MTDSITDSMELFSYFMGALVIVALAGYLIFFRGGNAAFKRLYFPSFVIVCGGLFAMGVLSIFPKLPVALVVALWPSALLFGYACVQATKFCDRCGSTVLPNGRLRPRTNCPKCGAPLK